MRITPGSGPASLRYVQAERFRGHEIDDELELRRLHHRQIGGLFTFEAATSIDADQPVHRRSHHFVGEDPVMIAITPADNFFQGGSPKTGHPISPPGPSSLPEIVSATFPGMAPG